MADKNNWDSNVTLTGSDDSDNFGNWGGSNVAIYTGNGSNTVYSSEGMNILVSGGNGNDSVRILDCSQITISANDGNDTITNNGTNAILDGGAGNDVIENINIYVLLNGEAVSLRPDNSWLIGGDGDDSIRNEGANVTISGGNGNDTLTGSSQVEIFIHEAGNDVITNYSGEDIIYIPNGAVNNVSFSGADLIFQTDSGSLTLQNMKNHAINIMDSSGQITTQIFGTGYSGSAVMKNFVQSLANSSLDEAIRASSHFNSLQDVIDNLLNDLNRAGDGETFLREYCGIFTDNNDTGAITGWDAGGLTIKSKDDLFPANFSEIYPASNAFICRGLTFTVPDRSTLTEQEQSIVQKIYSAYMEDALNLIEETYGFSFTDKPLTLPLSFVYDTNSTASAWGGVGGVTINMLSSAPENIAFYLPHELTHVMQQHFGIFDSLKDFMIEGMADITADCDIRQPVNLANDSYRLAQCLAGNPVESGDNYVGGVIFWRYFMRQAADNYGGSTYASYTTPSTDNHVYTGGNAVISNYAGEQITVGMLPKEWMFYGSDFYYGSNTGTLVVQGVKDKILDFRDGNGNSFVKAYSATYSGVSDGRTWSGFEYIVGSDYGADAIFAGDGGSSLWGGNGSYDDTLIGGAATDVFVSGKSQGNDVISNASSADVIFLPDVEVRDILYVNEQNNTLALTFNTGNSLLIGSTDYLSARMDFADGASWRFNHSTRSWQRP